MKKGSIKIRYEYKNRAILHDRLWHDVITETKQNLKLFTREKPIKVTRRRRYGKKSVITEAGSKAHIFKK